MPSGAKRRKAAKKKQQREASNTNDNNNNASTNNNDGSRSSSPLGNDDPRSQDERDSDGGEVGSPASQDHQNQQHPFKETIEDPSPVQSFDTENKSIEEVARDIKGTKEVGIEDGGATKIESSLKSEEDLRRQSISIEFVKESHDGSSSSSSSSSDDESQLTEKKLKDSANDSMLGATPHNGEDNPVDSFPVEIIQDTEKASLGEADKSDVNTAAVVDLVEEAANGSVSGATPHNGEDKPVDSFPIEIIQDTENASLGKADKLVAEAVETRLEENEESKKTEDKVFPMVEDNVGAPSTVVESVANGSEGKVLPTSDASIAKTNNGAANIRDSKIPDSSESQPLSTSAPQVAQRTSWMSCCGLLDLLAGSGR